MSLIFILRISVPEFVDRMQSPNTISKSRFKNRRKRQMGTPKIEPELLLFVDYALFKDFGGDSNELLEYLLHFWHSVSLLSFLNGDSCKQSHHLRLTHKQNLNLNT